MTTKSMNGTAHERHIEQPISDLDLMLYLDGELSADRHDEVRRALTRDKALRSKLSALEVTSTIIRERAVDAAANIDLTDSVMAKILAGDAAVSLDKRDIAPVLDLDQSEDSSTHPAEQVRLEKLGARSQPSNDNARSIFALVALAVAAAASFMVWGRLAPNPSTTAPVAMVTTQEVAPAKPPAELPMQPAIAPEPETVEEPEVGVEVAAVDFGSKVGTVFYVPTEAAASTHTTTVVWLTDTDGEEK